MPKREFLMKAHKYNPRKHGICGWFMSEKLDGIRCFWDGGISRGYGCDIIPWANTAKHGRFQIPPKATGLWTRYGQPIQAPDSWLNKLPPFPLDGELTLGRRQWQATASCARNQTPDSRWEELKYAVFDSPSYQTIFEDGRINDGNYKKEFRRILKWIVDLHGDTCAGLKPQTPFYATLDFLRKSLPHSDNLILHEQIKLPGTTPQAKECISKKMAEVVELGGEGLMLRSPISFYPTYRSYDLLKVKNYEDAEAKVVGYVWAEQTDMDRSLTGIETNKLVGLMGSMICQLPNGVTFNLSGFTDLERRMRTKDGSYANATAEGTANPGAKVSDSIENPAFPRGSTITFKYRELSKDGVPKEASYLRKRESL